MDQGNLFDVFDTPTQVPSLPFAPRENSKRKTVVDNNEAAAKKSKAPEFGEFQEQNVIVLSREGCVQEVCLPPGYPIIKDVQNLKVASGQRHGDPAKEYPFVLDAFQMRSISCLERDESVLVSAHTSAGKTVIAEYAIAMALRDRQRVIYTSPIKALSNQKYRELAAEFEDVGLMTGDVVINSSASCLVMTTEILRNMLYHGSEVTREVKWVIYDEVHYMSSASRGVVWEETMILLPHSVKFVFLSATIPNAREFCLWISKLHNCPCNVVYTDKRPTPLQHYAFAPGGKGLHLVVDDSGKFKDDNFQKAIAEIGSSSSAKDTKTTSKIDRIGGARDRVKQSNQMSDLATLLKTLFAKNFDPVICFAFSKKDCESHALEVSKVDFTSPEEKNVIADVFSNAIDSLSEDDKKLPQVIDILPLLQQGIGIHHGGLLPIIKEITEILFQEGLLKVLFATETFAMGLNMPAKCVVFAGVQKFDGVSFRLLSSGEYIQMSGRAGRRGLDDRGIVVMVLDEKIDPPTAKALLKGDADPLKSSFHVGYNMLLNLLRVEDADPEYVIERSFYQFQNTRKAPAVRDELAIAQEEAKSLTSQIVDLPTLEEFHHLKSQLDMANAAMQAIRNHPDNAKAFLNAGRLLEVENWGWGILIGFSTKTSGSSAIVVLDTIMECEPRSVDEGKPIPFSNSNDTRSTIIPIDLKNVTAFSSIRVPVPAGGRLTSKDLKTATRHLKEASMRFGNLPLLDPIDDMNINDNRFKKLVRTIEALEDDVLSHIGGSMVEEYALFREKLAFDTKCKSLEGQLHDIDHNLLFRHNIKHMKRVLRTLDFVSQDNIVTIKGRVACEITTSNELVTSELIFSGALGSFTSEQICALLSCLVFSEGAKTSVKTLPEHLSKPFEVLKTKVAEVADVIQSNSLAIDKELFLNQFKPDLMEVVYNWCQGAKFSDLCKMTQVYEGSIIRCIRRLEELLNELITSSKMIGNSEFVTKFTDCSAKIHRDIVFAASLYL